uniref:Uncharacterized protein n=1 Tax=Oryza meridionalis TaxID=40149 RepID=A0A0E0E2D7_9ORYZ
MERSTSHDVYMSVPRFFCILSHIRDFDMYCAASTLSSTLPSLTKTLCYCLVLRHSRHHLLLDAAEHGAPRHAHHVLWSYRQKLRATFGMAPEPCADCCLQLFCDRCSLSQMYRELKNRGVNPANGN